MLPAQTKGEIRKRTNMPPETPPTSPTPPSRQVAFDWRDWLPYLADADIPNADKQAMIEALWSIIQAFVDLGFEVKSPDELSAQTCGEAIDLKAALAAAMVSSSDEEQDAA